MKIYLDTNFLIDIVRFKVSLDEIEHLLHEPYGLATIDSVIRELERLSKRKTKEGGYSKIALLMLKEYKVEIVKSEGHTDKILLHLSKTTNMIIATNDIGLRKKLKTSGKRTIYLKSKKHLAVG